MSFRVAEDGILEDFEEEDQVHQLEIVVDENASTPSRKRASITKSPLPQKVAKTSLFGSIFSSFRSMIGLSSTDDDDDEEVEEVFQVPSASSRQVLHSTHQNSNESKKRDSIVFEGVVEKPDVIATTPGKSLCLPKAWPPAEETNQEETQEEDSESTEDEVEVIGEVTVSPKTLLTNERRSVEEIMTAVTGAEVVTVDDSGSDSISIISARNGETCLSPGPDDSISRQNTPRSFYEPSEFRTPRDSFSRRRPNRKQERSIPRVGANTPRSSRLEKGQKRRESLYFTPSKEMVAETGGHLIYAESLRRSSVAIRAAGGGGGGYTPKSTSIFKKSHATSVNPIEYLHRVRVAMKKMPLPKETPVVTLDDDSSSQSSGSSVQILNDEVEVLPNLREPPSAYLTSARARVDDLLATYALTSQKDREVFETVELYKREKTLWKRQEEELHGQHKQLADNRKKNDVCIEDEIRERLELMGIVTPKPKPKEKDEFPELPAEGKELVKRAWTRLSTDELFCEAFEIKIRRKDLLTLSGLQWLNDEIINFYMQLICQRSTQEENLPKVYAFNTFFYPTVNSRGHAGVKRWTRKVDIFSYEIILIPVHVNKIHWCMAVIDLGKKRIDYFDSMLGTNDKCLMDLQQYLKDESRDKKKCEFDMSSWSLTNRQDCPRQTNGSDCGVFSCRVAEYSSRRRPFNFSQEHMPYYRERMVYEIVNKKLL